MGIARIAAAVFGVIYLAAGVAGFVTGTSPLFGLFPVNVSHNVVHIVLGAILVYGMMSTSVAILATRLVGAILLVLGVLGFFVPDGFGLVPLGGSDVWLHLGSAVVLLGVGFLTSEEPAMA